MKPFSGLQPDGPDEPLVPIRSDAPWADSLACAIPGHRYLVEDIVFGLVRDLCEELGCGEGTVVTCTKNGGGGVHVVVPDGRERLVERPVAWFVRVSPVEEAVRQDA